MRLATALSLERHALDACPIIEKALPSTCVQQMVGYSDFLTAVSPRISARISFRLLIFCFGWLLIARYIMLGCFGFASLFLDVALLFTPEVDEGRGLTVRAEVPDVGRLNVHGFHPHESKGLLTDDPRAVFVRGNEVDLLDVFVVGHRRSIMHGGSCFASLFYRLLKKNPLFSQASPPRRMSRPYAS